MRLRDLRTGKRLNLYDLQQQSVRVLYSETACPYTFVDAEYYRSRGWKEGNSPIVWIVESLPRRQKKKYRKRFGKGAPIYVVRDDESLGWLSDLDHSPANYEIDLNRNQLCDWALHPYGRGRGAGQLASLPRPFILFVIDNWLSRGQMFDRWDPRRLTGASSPTLPASRGDTALDVFVTVLLYMFVAGTTTIARLGAPNC